MEEVGRQVLTNAQPAVQPGLWGGTEVRKALSKGEEGTAGGRGPISCRAKDARGCWVSVGASLLGWHKVSAGCRGGVQLLVPISPRCSGNCLGYKRIQGSRTASKDARDNPSTEGGWHSSPGFSLAGGGQGTRSLHTGETENVCLISSEAPSSNCLQLLQK